VIENIYKKEIVILVMAEKKEDFSVEAYVFGIASIIFAIVSSLIGIILGIVGLVMSKKQKGKYSERARKLSKIGLILSIVIFVLTILAGILLAILIPQYFPSGLPVQ